MYDKELVASLKSKNLTVYEEVYEIRMGISMKCTRNCSFCGITRKPSEDMTQKTLNRIIDTSTPRLKKLCMSVYGESIMHPKIVDYIGQLRDRIPKLQISTITNTDWFKKKSIGLLFDMFEAGLNFVIADLYDVPQEQWFMKQLKENESLLESKGIQVKSFYEAEENIWSYNGINKKKIFIVADQNGPGTGGSKATRQFHTYGGNLDMDEWPEKVRKLPFPLMKSCAEPLKYLTLTANGDAYMCCRDGGLSGKLGSVHEQGINDLWQCDKMQMARYVLKLGRRDLILPCVLCNAKTFRSGLYPYWGKKYETEELRKGIKSLSTLKKSEPIYKNLQRYMRETGWEPGELMSEVINEAK